MSLRIINHLINGIQIDEDCTCGFQHFSGIYKNGKPLYRGQNHLRNSYNNECICYSTHAEMDVLYKLLKSYKIQPFKDFIDLSKHVIIVVRIGRDGLIKNSRPCNNCLDIMSKYRIKKIMYSNDNGSFNTEKPFCMEKLHISSGWIAYNSPERLKK
jgi:deoxycytidylate deaminase